MPFDVMIGLPKPHTVNPHIVRSKDAAFRPNGYIPAPRLIAADIVADLEAALDGARSAEMVSVLHAGPERYAMGDGCRCPSGQRTSQQFSAIEADLKE